MKGRSSEEDETTAKKCVELTFGVERSITHLHRVREDIGNMHTVPGSKAMKEHQCINAIGTGGGGQGINGVHTGSRCLQN